MRPSREKLHVLCTYPQLMPRIRNWKDLTLYAPSARFARDHITHLQELFSDTIDFPHLRFKPPP